MCKDMNERYKSNHCRTSSSKWMIMCSNTYLYWFHPKFNSWFHYFWDCIFVIDNIMPFSVPSSSTNFVFLEWKTDWLHPLVEQTARFALIHYWTNSYQVKNIEFDDLLLYIFYREKEPLSVPLWVDIILKH